MQEEDAAQTHTIFLALLLLEYWGQRLDQQFDTVCHVIARFSLLADNHLASQEERGKTRRGGGGKRRREANREGEGEENLKEKRSTRKRWKQGQEIRATLISSPLTEKEEGRSRGEKTVEETVAEERRRTISPYDEEEKGDGATEQEQRDVEQKQREIRKTTGEFEQGESHNCRSVPSGADVLLDISIERLLLASDISIRLNEIV
ncbi:hypothetical protein EAG_09756 [Camponotus floridanus]|uniref:Uncharacterized protein n=1 Tax=Camponotus floridanus TaxID=104421 RepID=E2ANP2_CAMFO|nr:hypothetical protein EAG_09756 [Camponotus floridanus]